MEPKQNSKRHAFLLGPSSAPPPHLRASHHGHGAGHSHGCASTHRVDEHRDLEPVDISVWQSRHRLAVCEDVLPSPGVRTKERVEVGLAWGQLSGKGRVPQPTPNGKPTGTRRQRRGHHTHSRPALWPAAPSGAVAKAGLKTQGRELDTIWNPHKKTQKLEWYITTASRHGALPG